MTSQTELFVTGEGDAWFRRNRAFIKTRTRDNDLLFREVQALLSHGRGGSYLEVGCSDGYRLPWIKELGVRVLGIEPSRAAIDRGRADYGLTKDELIHTHAHQFFTSTTMTFDVIAFAHCLYLIPPSEIPRIVSGAIESLNEGGCIVVYDFDSVPQAQPYHHLEGAWSYKADFARYFTWLPFMRLIRKSVAEHKGGLSCGNPQEDCALSIIRKIPVEHAFPMLAGAWKR